jgi:hypothetical protein
MRQKNPKESTREQGTCENARRDITRTGSITDPVLDDESGNHEEEGTELHDTSVKYRLLCDALRGVAFLLPVVIISMTHIYFLY